MDRRAELVAGALDYVLSEGLVGLSLRPLARRLGTSDRMLIYYFGSKEALIAEVVTLANRRIAESLGPFESAGLADGPPATAGDLVRHVWRELTATDIDPITGLYLEMCVLSARDTQRWAPAQEQLRESWVALARSVLAQLGVSPERLDATADLLLDTVDGLLLDRLVRGDPARADAASEAFARLLDGAGSG